MAQAEVLEPEDFFSAAVLSNPDVISVSRLEDGGFLQVNQAFLDMTGYRRDEVIGRTAGELGIWIEGAERERLIAILAAAFGVLATLLAAIGLYGVMAYSVARRTGEIGVRMALGAVPADVLRLVLFGAVRLAAAGIVIGLAGALAAGRLIESQLFGIKAADPVIYGGAALLLALVALIAAGVPAWRAARIDPVVALKYE